MKLTKAQAERFRDGWMRCKASGQTTGDYAAQLGISRTTIIIMRREAERVLRDKLPALGDHRTGGLRYWSGHRDRWLDRVAQPVAQPAPKAESGPRGRFATRHIVIPDTQVRKGVPIDHLRWIGAYIREHGADVVIHLGDHWDMPSLSMHDPCGSLPMEGARVEDDIASGNEAMAILTREIGDGPRKVLLRGNHENRIERAIYREPKWAQTLSDAQLRSPGWEVVPFQKIVDIDGIWYSHFFYNPLTGRPWSGTADNRLNKVGHSFAQGHEQTYRHGSRYLANGVEQHCLIAGACYLHDERYKGPQANHHWRGIIVMNEVRNGAYDIMRVSLNYLCWRYEGMNVGDFLRKRYPGQSFSLCEIDHGGRDEQPRAGSEAAPRGRAQKAPAARKR